MTKKNTSKSVPSARPVSIEKISTTNHKDSVKIATSNLFDITTVTDNADALTELTFQDLSGQEIINIVRHDSITGINPEYHPISNISSIASEISPFKLIKLQGTDKEYFESFPIILSDHISNNAINGLSDIYLTNQQIVIPLINADGYQIEVQFLSTANIQSDTIYQ